MKYAKENLELDKALEREWIITNGIGGFASSTIIGANTRKYHGLLVVPIIPPARRRLILSKLDESIEIDRKKYELFTNIGKNYISQGYKYQESFQKDILPTFEYKVEDVVITKTICMEHFKNTVGVYYKIKNGSKHSKLILAPVMNFRNSHGINKDHIFNIKQKMKNKKLEVKLDNLLGDLNNNYNLTYEAASSSYTLEMDADIARDHVSNLKRELNKLGNVNLGSIEEYERISKRYEFLTSQKFDLESASMELKGIINEMDDIMVEKFAKSFESIKQEFSKIFKMMFKGGRGELALSDPDDLLNTGIDIVAIPPGKKINSPVALSGGEKALTAICLLFAMLEVKPSPFVILDEAGAALDEVNVDMFGKYLSEEKTRSQFIVITHKKRMMEYADSLYGITMQESGVSKIVSAKLEN